MKVRSKRIHRATASLLGVVLAAAAAPIAASGCGVQVKPEAAEDTSIGSAHAADSFTPEPVSDPNLAPLCVDRGDVAMSVDPEVGTCADPDGTTFADAVAFCGGAVKYFDYTCVDFPASAPYQPDNERAWTAYFGCCVTYTVDVQPIFAAKCSPCHTTGDAGGVNFAATTGYPLTQLVPNANVAACQDITPDNVGACTLIRIQNGQMPKGRGCTGDPVADADNAACLTQAEQTTIANWIAGGELQ
jgi:hypothetical protein